MTPETRLDCRADDGFAQWLAAFPGSIAVTTYQAGKVVLLGWDGQRVSVLPRHFDKPMGLAVDWPRVALATRHELAIFADAPSLAPEFLEREPGRYDALILPRASYWTGDLNVHDVAFGRDGVIFAATRFGCLARPSATYCFEPFWTPPFVSEIAPEDRCHLNGIALVDGWPKFVTCLGATDEPGGWRDTKATGGVVVDVESRSIVATGLAMPHSPRWHDGALWLLNSGAGELLRYDAAGRSTVVATLPGYLRGLAFAGGCALIGLCQIRERHIFGGLPVQERFPQLLCGVAVVELATGRPLGLFEFTAGCQEVYDVRLLPGVRRPMLLNRERDAGRDAFPLAAASYWLRPSHMVADFTTPSGGQ